ERHRSSKRPAIATCRRASPASLVTDSQGEAMSYDLEAINTLFAQIAECMHRNPARAMRLLGEAKVKTREALKRAALAAQLYKGPWCCERAEAQGVPVCEECAEASAGYSAAMGSEATAAAQPAASTEPKRDHFKPPFDNCS